MQNTVTSNNVVEAITTVAGVPVLDSFLFDL
jgi:hypothetical protein